MPALIEVTAKRGKKSKQQTRRGEYGWTMAESGMGDSRIQRGASTSPTVHPWPINQHYCASRGPGTENKNSFFLILVWLPREMQVVCLNICILPAKAVKPVEIQISVWESPGHCVDLLPVESGFRTIGSHWTEAHPLGFSDLVHRYPPSRECSSPPPCLSSPPNWIWSSRK